MPTSPLVYLAQRFPQLYVAPGPYAEDAYKLAFTRGKEPADTSLDHFTTTPDDWLRVCETPAGRVEALFLADRADFETFVRCTTKRCRAEAVPASVGAMTIMGLPDWSVLRAKQAELIEELGDDWLSAYQQFITDPSNFKVTMIVISEGPNSAVPASAVGLDEHEWLVRSREIRLYHELAHVVCRRLMPADVLPVWDEVTADFHGILRAFGSYDAKLALRLLGVENCHYIGGRLAEYLSAEQLSRIDEIADALDLACHEIERQMAGAGVEDSYDLLLKLKRQPYVAF